MKQPIHKHILTVTECSSDGTGGLCVTTSAYRDYAKAIERFMDEFDEDRQSLLDDETKVEFSIVYIEPFNQTTPRMINAKGRNGKWVEVEHPTECVPRFIRENHSDMPAKDAIRRFTEIFTKFGLPSMRISERIADSPGAGIHHCEVQWGEEPVAITFASDHPANY